MKYANETILQNLEIAYTAVKGYDSQLFDLRTFREKSDCGIIHCSLGLLGTMPHFNKQGLEFSDHPLKDDADYRILLIEGVPVMRVSFSKLNVLFGDNCFNRLFQSKGYGTWDLQRDENPAFLENNPNLTDQKLALLRLEHQIKLVKEELGKEG